MGIKRCPYCRALISDRDQYCKNCGTQLLFPEDEEIEEEIPGDRIIEDDRQRDDSHQPAEEQLEEELEEEPESGEGLETESEPEEETELLLAKDKEETALLEEEEVERITGPGRGRSKPKNLLPAEKEKSLFGGDEETETGLKENLTSLRTEDYLVEKIKKEILSESEPEEPAEPGPGLVTRIVEEIQQKEAQAEAAETLPESRPGLVTRLVEELELKEKRAAAESYEVETGEEESSVWPTFETAELDKIGGTTELGKREVEDFLRVLEEKEKEYLKERLKTSGPDTRETGEVPSWVKEVKTASTELLSGGGDTGEVKVPEKAEAETDDLWLEEEETPTEPTIGFPEKLTRSGLKAVEAEEETGEVDMELEEKIEEEEEMESEGGQIFGEKAEPAATDRDISGRDLSSGVGQVLPPLSFKNFVKAKIFDLLFLVMFWLVSVWIAARSMETTIFKLFGLAGSGLLLYLLILTFFYFFLFYFFIGETLGDRLFRESDEEEEGL
ncbi:MAG: zinc ribbon domain-containing protein [Candidatus Saccharicenans sp.]|nr:zinc ribbon domain-containing protein [Candidatus Saccharicenans sp.]